MSAVRHVTPADREAWQRMRVALWPDHGGDFHRGEIESFLAGKLRMPLAVLVACDAGGAPIGFAELSIRPYAEGCETDRVAFLEGWYVDPHARRSGVGTALVRAAEDWARSQGCTEFASDALVDNDVSTAAHKALGFSEVEVIRCFMKNV